MIYKIILVISWFYISFGIIGIFRFKNMYSRLLTSSKIDTVASIPLIFALIVKSGFTPVSIRLILILIFILITGPISNHVIVRSAYLNDIPVNQEEVT